MIRILWGALFLAIGIASAGAACPASSAQMKDNAAANFQMALTNDPTGTNCASITNAVPPAPLTTLSAWTSATGSNTTQTLFSAGGWSAVILQLNQTPTLTPGAITIEGPYNATNLY